MTEDEEKRLRVAIREAFDRNDWEGDIGFLVPDVDQSNESDLPHEFEVMVVDDEVAIVIPASWETVPYLREVLSNIAAQELNAHLGVQPN